MFPRIWLWQDEQRKAGAESTEAVSIPVSETEVVTHLLARRVNPKALHSRLFGRTHARFRRCVVARGWPHRSPEVARQQHSLSSADAGDKMAKGPFQEHTHAVWFRGTLSSFGAAVAIFSCGQGP